MIASLLSDDDHCLNALPCRSLKIHRALATMAFVSRWTAACVSSTPLLHQRGSALADFLKRHFEATKLLRAQFREHSLHLPGMLSKG